MTTQNNIVFSIQFEYEIEFLIYFLLGSSFCMFIFSTASYLSNKRKEFLYYAFYILSIALYFVIFLNPSFKWDDTIHLRQKILISHIGEVIIQIFYLLFVLSYLDLKDKLQKAYKIGVMILYVLIGIGLYYCVSLFAYNHSITEALRLFRTFGLPAVFTPLSIYIIYKLRNTFAFLTLAGSFAITIGSIIYGITNNFEILILGVIIELLVFGLGLLYKQKVLREKQSQMEVEIALTKNKALRAQVNTHFIFNALSSIQYLVTKNERLPAINYLLKFSRLIRAVFESSFQTNALLSEEIKLLKDYLELESLRFNDAFQYEINISEELDPAAIEIPFMLLQPFVENAIIHGLMPKDSGDKLLVLSFKVDLKSVLIIIEDNGVGRAKANQFKRIHTDINQSRGLEITRQRLASFGQQDQSIEIIDKLNIKQEPIGTKVVIKLPINHLS